jgi:peptidoglycan/LPS O-acetylase OafA/YrhL
MIYPVIAISLLRLRRPVPTVVAIAVWSLLWGGLASAVDRNASDVEAWAVARYGAVAGTAHGTQDSFMLWIEYFSPYLRIGEFGLGCLIAQLHLQLRERKISQWEWVISQPSLALAIASVPLFLFLVYPQDGRHVTLLYSLRLNYGLAPSAAVILFCTLRYETPFARLLRARPIVALGEASYSIYLFHLPVMLLVATGYVGQELPASGPNILYFDLRLVFVLAMICLIALGLSTFIEAPTRRWLRGLLGARTPRPG